MIIPIHVYEEHPSKPRFSVTGFTKVNSNELGLPYATQLYDSYAEKLEVPEWLKCTTGWVVRTIISKVGDPARYGYQLWLDTHRDYEMLIKLKTTEEERIAKNKQTYQRFMDYNFRKEPGPSRAYPNNWNPATK